MSSYVLIFLIFSGTLKITMQGLNDLWLITAGVFVFLMQPGFAALEAGFVQAKNVTSISY